MSDTDFSPMDPRDEWAVAASRALHPSAWPADLGHSPLPRSLPAASPSVERRVLRCVVVAVLVCAGAVASICDEVRAVWR